MDVEQFKLMLEAINNVGGEAKEFGIWWLACGTIPAVLWFAFGVGFLAVASRRIHEGVSSWSAAYAIAREVGHPVRIMWTDSDTDSVLEKIRSLKGQ